MIVEKIEDTLNGGYKGLYGEVVGVDIYKLRELKFVPDVIFDLGANVGVFTRFARELFPSTFIVAVEPDAQNFAHMVKFTPADENIAFINKAIGSGIVFRRGGAVNGAHESYVTPGVGYPKDLLIESVEVGGSKGVIVAGVTVADLLGRYLGQKILLKIDIEGNEQAIFSDPLSMQMMKSVDYIAIELHKFAIRDSLLPEVISHTKNAISTFSDTHDCFMDEPNSIFYAIKKSNHEAI